MPFLVTLLLAATNPYPQLGRLSFPVTGNAACNASFERGILLLHSFVYADAHLAFQAAEQADPTCAMAHWGDAMASIHSLWEEENLPAAREALATVGDESKLTAKERSYLAAARALTSDAPVTVRLQRWLAAASEMHQAYPDDDEVTLQNALALLNNDDDGRDVRRAMEAAALAQEVFTHNPQHPGAAHYLIHAFDSPEHAVLGLPAARKYAAIAPAAAHALHMPSHIFVQLGMWPDVLASNLAAWEADGVEARKHHTENARNWHTFGWIISADLELGRVHEAERSIAQARAWLASQDSLDLRAAYVSFVQAYVTHTGRWDRLSGLLSPLDRPPAPQAGVAADQSRLRIQLGIAGARGEAAMWNGDSVGVAQAFAPLDSAFAALETVRPQEKQRAHAHGLEMAEAAGARALHSHAAADLVEAVADFRAAAAGDGVSGPAFAPPSRELAGQLLAKLGRPSDALVEFQAALEAHPNRAPALLGAARAAAASGDLVAAQGYDATLRGLWATADSDATDLAEVQRPK